MNMDEVDKIFHAFIEGGLLEPDFSEEGKFFLSPMGLVFIDSMIQVYGICGLAERMAHLQEEGRFEDLSDSIRTRLLH